MPSKSKKRKDWRESSFLNASDNEENKSILSLSSNSSWSEGDMKLISRKRPKLGSIESSKSADSLLQSNQSTKQSGALHKRRNLSIASVESIESTDSVLMISPLKVRNTYKNQETISKQSTSLSFDSPPQSAESAPTIQLTSSRDDHDEVELSDRNEHFDDIVDENADTNIYSQTSAGRLAAEQSIAARSDDDSVFDPAPLIVRANKAQQYLETEVDDTMEAPHPEFASNYDNNFHSNAEYESSFSGALAYTAHSQSTATQESTAHNDGAKLAFHDCKYVDFVLPSEDDSNSSSSSDDEDEDDDDAPDNGENNDDSNNLQREVASQHIEVKEHHKYADGDSVVYDEYAYDDNEAYDAPYDPEYDVVHEQYTEYTPDERRNNGSDDYEADHREMHGYSQDSEPLDESEDGADRSEANNLTNSELCDAAFFDGSNKLHNRKSPHQTTGTVLEGLRSPRTGLTFGNHRPQTQDSPQSHRAKDVHTHNDDDIQAFSDEEDYVASIFGFSARPKLTPQRKSSVDYSGPAVNEVHVDEVVQNGQNEVVEVDVLDENAIREKLNLKPRIEPSRTKYAEPPHTNIPRTNTTQSNAAHTTQTRNQASTTEQTERPRRIRNAATSSVYSVQGVIRRPPQPKSSQVVDLTARQTKKTDNSKLTWFFSQKANPPSSSSPTMNAPSLPPPAAARQKVRMNVGCMQASYTGESEVEVVDMSHPSASDWAPLTSHRPTSFQTVPERNDITGGSGVGAGSYEIRDTYEPTPRARGRPSSGQKRTYSKSNNNWWKKSKKRSSSGGKKSKYARKPSGTATRVKRSSGAAQEDRKDARIVKSEQKVKRESIVKSEKKRKASL
jgi:hypothetical protein